MARVLCIGGCHWDVRLIADQALVGGESTPVRSITSPGGAVSNVARALAGQGHQVEITSVVGRNPPEAERLSPLSKRFDDRDSGRYISLEHADGSLVYGLADLDLYDAMDAQWYEGLSAACDQFDAVVVDCNATAEALSALACTVPLFAVAVSPPKAGNFARLCERFEGLFLNRLEAEVLGSQALTAKNFVKTLGTDGAELLQNGVMISKLSAPSGKPAHVNGLGDRLAGLVISRVLGGEDWPSALAHSLDELLEGWT